MIEALVNLDTEIKIMLKALKLQFKAASLIKDVALTYQINMFGTVVCVMTNRYDYDIVADIANENFKGWNIFYIALQDSLLEKKEELIWELMRGGYMRWLRYEYQLHFKQILTMQNLGLKIIKERLRRFNDEPRFTYHIESNKWAQGQTVTYILAMDPGFFDYMP